VERICFRLRVRPDRVDEYRSLHAQVWPEMREALRQAGWHNYSLFLDDDGQLIGYVEVESWSAARTAMEATEVNGRWQAVTAPLFDGMGGLRPDQAMRPIPEVFHLD
jgi:L-rhamnose mutarotase